MKIGFAKADITQAITLRHPEFEVKLIGTETEGKADGALQKAQGARTGEKLYSRDILNNSVAFSERERKLLDLSDKKIVELMAERKGLRRKIVTPVEMSLMYGNDAEGVWVILSFDLCESGYKLVDTIKNSIREAFGIPSERIIILYSHAHNGIYELDEEMLKSLVIDAVEYAVRDAEEVEIGRLNLEVENGSFSMNRRIYIDGIGTRTVMYNDACRIEGNSMDAADHIRRWIEDLGSNPADYIKPDAVIRPHGPVDNSLNGIFFRSKASGRMKGCFVRFSCHSCAVSHIRMKGDISADYPGYMKHRLEKALGGIAVFGNGASGDIKPLNPEYSHEYAQYMGESLADKLIDAFGSIDWQPLKELRFDFEPVALSIREEFPGDASEIENRMRELEEQYDKTDKPAERRKLQNLYRLYGFSWDLLENLRPEWLAKRQVEANIHAIRLNDTAIITSNGEIFTSTGQAMIEPAKDRHPLLATIADEELYYVVPQEEFEKGGYEVGGCFLAPGSAEKLVDHSHRLLKRIFETQ